MDERLFAGYIAFRDRYANRLDSVIRSTSDAGFDTPLSEKIPLLSENGSYDLFTEPISRSYAAEAENLLKIGNDLVSEALSAGYDEARETQYLPAKRITDDYEAKISEGRKPELFEISALPRHMPRPVKPMMRKGFTILYFPKIRMNPAPALKRGSSFFRDTTAKESGISILP